MKQAIEQYLGSKEIYFYWKGRVALYALLKVMGVQEGDEVILPAFTCVVVPNAIKYLGAKPIYVDIDLNTYNTTAEKVCEKITDKTKVILCQNTFGLSSQVEEIVALARSKNIYTIEDCTHGFGGTYNGKPNGSYCDAAFYSTQWNKPFSTGVGGFLLLNNLDLKESLVTVNQSIEVPKLKERFMLKVLQFVKRHILKPSTYWTMVKLYRWLSKMNLVVGSSQGEEIESVNMPEGYFKGMSSVQFKEGERNLKGLKNQLELRQKNAAVYTDYLKKKGKVFVDEQLNQNHSFLKYPLLVQKRDEFLDLAEGARIEMGEWFNSPIHPVQEKHELWDLDLSQFPNALKASAEMVNLPTDVKDPQVVLNFLDKNIDLVK